MCLRPIWVHGASGARGYFRPCGACWHCVETKRNDLFGRLLAEAFYADLTLCMTLTYRERGGGVDHSGGVVVPDTSHVSAFVRALRDDGWSVRYHITAEYGGGKGRLHWHAVLFFADEGNGVPSVVTPCHGKGCVLLCQDLPCSRDRRGFVGRRDPRVWWGRERDLNQKFLTKYWPHGFVTVDGDGSDDRAIGYGVKYAIKGVHHDGFVGAPPDDRVKPVRVFSKRPILGFRMISDLVDRYLERGIEPQKPAFEVRANGVTRSFWLHGKSREWFARLYLERSGQEWPVSDFLNRYQDGQAKEKEFHLQDWLARINDNSERYRAAASAWRAARPEEDQRKLVVLLDPPPVETRYIHLPNDLGLMVAEYDDGSFDLVTDQGPLHLPDGVELDRRLRDLGSIYGFRDGKWIARHQPGQNPQGSKRS